MIRFEGVSRLFGEVRAVSELDLAIRERELCVLLGPSGSGKSTVLRMVNRLIEPSSGRILVAGRDVATVKPEELRRGIGYAIQGVGLFPHMSVAANIATVPALLGWEKKRIEKRAFEMLELVGLDPEKYAARFPSELSGGEAQRVGVARALASDPPVLLMDEPFSAVDPVNRSRLQAEFLSIQRRLKKTIVFVTHDIDEAVRLADRIALLRGGRLVQYDEPETILDAPVDDFVADFFGSDRALRRLSRFPVRDWMRPYGGPRSGGAPSATVDRDASLRDALSAMLSGRSRDLVVVGDSGGPEGELGFGDIELAAGDSSA